MSNWTELDVWRYIEREDIELPSLYYAHEREVFSRDGMWLPVGPATRPRRGEQVRTLTVRYRTVGDMSCTGAVESTAATNHEIAVEVACRDSPFLHPRARAGRAAGIPGHETWHGIK